MAGVAAAVARAQLGLATTHAGADKEFVSDARPLRCRATFINR